MRVAMILALVLMVSASTAYAWSGAGSVVVDIVGSSADNTNIVTSGLAPVELELIGSVANNTMIGPLPDCPVVCPDCCCPEERCECTEQSSASEGRHTGVDAWYGTFWYGNINMPRWPHL